MKIQVLDDSGDQVFLFDQGTKTSVRSLAAVPADLAGLLREAADFASDHHVIASIKADVRAVVARIETELGAHPAFTWAQAKLSNAAFHLEHYAAGIWTEPTWPAGVALDARGMIVPAADGVITNSRPEGKAETEAPPAA